MPRLGHGAPQESLRLERVDAVPYLFATVALRLYAVPVTIEGEVIKVDRPQEQLLLHIDGKKRSEPPFATWFEKTDEEVHIAVVVYVGYGYLKAANELKKY